MFNISLSTIKPSWKWALGGVLIGYLGYYVIRWIINKCLKVAAMDEVANFLLKKSPRNSYKTLEISPEKIKMGYGEYVVFRIEGEVELSKDTYEKVYNIFDKYSPANIVNAAVKDPTISAEEQCANRYELIRGKVKELDPSLDIAFVPRTLYELILLRKCIQEDVKANEICSSLNPITQRLVHCPKQKVYVKALSAKERAKMIEDIQAKQLKKKCWHLCYFDDAGDNQNQSVKDVAYRLNRAIVKTLSPEAGGLTYEQLSQHTEKEIDFLKKHYAEQKEEPSSCSISNPTTNFKTESRRGSIRPMGIRHDQDAQIIKNAVAVECSKIAERSFLISRGANFEKDAPHSWKNPNRPFSTSWSTGLFSGCVYNGEDASYYYMRNGSDGYIIPVPFERLNDSPFYIPTTNAIAQLFGTGEIFHARSKAWKEADIDTERLPGIQMGEKRIEHLKSDLTKEELIAQYQTFKDNAIQLR